MAVSSGQFVEGCFALVVEPLARSGACLLICPLGFEPGPSSGAAGRQNVLQGQSGLFCLGHYGAQRSAGRRGLLRLPERQVVGRGLRISPILDQKFGSVETHSGVSRRRLVARLYL